MAGIGFIQLLKNSWAIDLLLVFSVIALAVILERLWSYSRLRVDEKALIDKVQRALKKGNIQEASFICRSTNHPLGQILDTGINNKDLPREDIADLLDGELIEARSYLERKNSVLSTISFIAPLLGLLGTVTGIIRAFHDLSVSGSGGGPSTVMAGVAEALVSTAIGIIVAIPAAIFYNYFMNKVKVMLTEIEANSRRFLAFLHTNFTKGQKETLKLD